jgi:uncharacterized damage-inducible protein DinB
MQSFFEEIFEYQNEVNQDILMQLGELNNFNSEKVLELLSHSMNAQKLWNYRILENTEKIVFKTYTLEELIVLDAKNFNDALMICMQSDFKQRIDYKSTSGKAYHNTVQEILTQVSQHFQYHRGQIMAELVKNNVKMKQTDYIYYRRKFS